jgi:hypothetical protein
MYPKSMFKKGDGGTGISGDSASLSSYAELSKTARGTLRRNVAMVTSSIMPRSVGFGKRFSIVRSAAFSSVVMNIYS